MRPGDCGVAAGPTLFVWIDAETSRGPYDRRGNPELRNEEHREGPSQPGPYEASPDPTLTPALGGERCSAPSILATG